MALLHFTAADVKRTLDLPGIRAVDALVASKVLKISAYTPRGRPLFDAESVRRAAEHAMSAAERRPA